MMSEAGNTMSEWDELLAILDKEMGQEGTQKRLDQLWQRLTPLGKMTFAMTLLARIARESETAPEPVHGGSVIDSICDAAKQFYRPPAMRDKGYMPHYPGVINLRDHFREKE